MRDPVLTGLEFEALRRYIQDACGIHIPSDKRYLIQQRLADMVLDTGCRDYSQLCSRLANDPSLELREQVIAAITTNETSFFRDQTPFAAFNKVILPDLGERVKQRRRDHPGGGLAAKARVWSAGASFGQEPYSLAMLIHEFAQAHRFLGLSVEDFSLLASDVSPAVLARAKAGVYNEVEMGRGLDEVRRSKYFVSEGGHWRITREISQLVAFIRVNLAEPFSMLMTFDVIFCRNVLIYFDEETKRRIIDKFHSKLTPGGFLVLGSAESLYGISDAFETMVLEGATVYVRKD